MITELHQVERRYRDPGGNVGWLLVKTFHEIDSYPRAVELAREEARTTTIPHRVVRVMVTDTFDPGA